MSTAVDNEEIIDEPRHDIYPSSDGGRCTFMNRTRSSPEQPYFDERTSHAERAAELETNNEGW